MTQSDVRIADALFSDARDCLATVVAGGTRRYMERLLEAWDTAASKKDAAAIAALYTEDAMRITPGGFQYGRAAIEKGDWRKHSRLPVTSSIKSTRYRWSAKWFW